ncbi:MAG: acyl-ACP--UDP-N-acetylglucosamine O-acyltransferase [Candidatus Dadabacteria bacterium]|nr:MAG: acyl-ACP--UDP-N-acetylglucosamine O-acyltransferase [Candidatus Dadabacteria bacterium]
MAQIHHTAVVDPRAEIGSGTSIGPYTVVGPKVVIGENNRIGSHVVIEGNTTIGSGNNIFQFASIGAVPQDLKFSGEDSTLIIGDNNIIREYVTLQPGTAHGGMKTVIGNNNMFMACSHVGHDGRVGSYNVFANSAALAGHVVVEDHVTIGGMCGVHQFVKLGRLAILGAGAMVNKDVPPFCTVQGDRARLVGINKIGLERHGFSSEEINSLRRLYRAVFEEQGLFRERLERLLAEQTDFEAGQYFIRFMMESERGITFPRKKNQLSV